MVPLPRDDWTVLAEKQNIVKTPSHPTGVRSESLKEKEHKKGGVSVRDQC